MPPSEPPIRAQALDLRGAGRAPVHGDEVGHREQGEVQAIGLPVAGSVEDGPVVP